MQEMKNDYLEQFNRYSFREYPIARGGLIRMLMSALQAWNQCWLLSAQNAIANSISQELNSNSRPWACMGIEGYLFLPCDFFFIFSLKTFCCTN